MPVHRIWKLKMGSKLTLPVLHCSLRIRWPPSRVIYADNLFDAAQHRRDTDFILYSCSYLPILSFCRRCVLCVSKCALFLSFIFISRKSIGNGRTKVTYNVLYFNYLNLHSNFTVLLFTTVNTVVN